MRQYTRLEKNIHYREESITNWEEVQRVVKEKNIPQDFWLFRGEAGDTQRLQPTLERFMEIEGIKSHEKPRFESKLLRKFQRHYAQYSAKIPRQSQVLEWLSIMQHYGAPTRLLDCSWSFYVALFFSIEYKDFSKDDNENKKFVVWAINAKWLERCFVKKHPKAKKMFSPNMQLEQKGNFLRFSRMTGVIAQNPFQLNERLIIQNGNFLVPSNIRKTFEKNMLYIIEGNVPDNYLYKYVLNINKSTRKEFLKQLSSMNISRATLFPGLDGFAESLIQDMLADRLTQYPDKNIFGE